MPWMVWWLMVLILLALGWYALGRLPGTDWGKGWMNRLDRLNRLFCRYYHRMQGGALPLPEKGAAIVAANHLSGLDPMLLIAASPRPLHFLIAAEQYHRFGLTWLFRAVGCIPLERGGRAERAFREALKVLRNGGVIAIFPQGGIHLDEEPHKRLKPGVARLAALADCPVYPVRLDGMRAQGDVFKPVFLRAHASLHPHPPRQCAEEEQQHCLTQLAQDLAPQRNHDKRDV